MAVAGGKYVVIGFGRDAQGLLCLKSTPQDCAQRLLPNAALRLGRLFFAHPDAAANVQGAPLKVHVPPLQSEHFTDAQAGERQDNKKRAELGWYSRDYRL